METNVIHYKDARNMEEVDDNSVRLIITSHPYWNVKDYSLDRTQSRQHSEKVNGQIGDIQSYDEYLDEMLVVWEECERILKPNGKLCINVPLMPIKKDVLSTHYNRDIIDINSGIEQSILKGTNMFLYEVYIWNKINSHIDIMFGSYPHPPNFYARNSIEFVTIYVKDGKPDIVDKDIKEKSKLSQAEWVEFTQQIWNIPTLGRADKAFGQHPAIMPINIPIRLIKLFSFYGDVILDPFCGSGTTLKAAQDLGRVYIGYEIYKHYEKGINNRLDEIKLFLVEGENYGLLNRKK
jgi:site-specific DNA-methyltransferase (cytosine-N4-specific)